MDWARSSTDRRASCETGFSVVEKRPRSIASATGARSSTGHISKAVSTDTTSPLWHNSRTSRKSSASAGCPTTARISSVSMSHKSGWPASRLSKLRKFPSNEAVASSRLSDGGLGPEDDEFPGAVFCGGVADGAGVAGGAELDRSICRHSTTGSTASAVAKRPTYSSRNVSLESDATSGAILPRILARAAKSPVSIPSKCSSRT